MTNYHDLFPPTVNEGDLIVYLRQEEEREGIVVGFGWSLGQHVVVLRDGAWCYHSDVIRKEKKCS